MPTQDKGIDFIAYDDRGGVTLVGQVKSRIGTSQQWAAQFRRNMLAHETLPNARFFLIATPEQVQEFRQLTITAATQ